VCCEGRNSFINDGLRVWDSYKNTVSNNTVNEKPLIYLENSNDKIVGDAGQIILIECDNITIQHQELSKTDVGIELWDTHNCLIYDNNISKTYNGLFINYHSSNNTIKDNNISDTSIGIWFLEESSNNIIQDNFLSGREFVDLYYKYSPSTANLIAKHKPLRLIVQINLTPFVVFSYSMVHFGPIVTGGILLLILVLPTFFIYVTRRR